jgi:non-heme chloroperoxidase
MTITDRERAEIDRANASDSAPVVFVHGLWLLAGSWDGWRRHFEDAGYVTLAPGWPDEPESVEEARAHPEVFANKRVQQVTDRYADIVRRLHLAPAIVGHSFGGLIAQKLAGMGLSAATVAIDPAPFRGVLPLPFSSIRAAWPVLGNLGNYRRAVPLTFAQFRYAFANAVSEDEARELYDTYAVATSGVPLFQAATANLHPRTEARVDTTTRDRGPLLVISGAKDNTVPWAMANAAYRRQRRNESVTEIREIPERGHSLVIDSGWREVADVALEFVHQHHPPQPFIGGPEARTTETTP